ncbi:MAG: branched-chain amino acid ABC transporter permease [Alphaproteobacteria bacterium]|nr:branched-chain amino acid ABC transporter permease [Alphaproteobacteria bacterium]
MDYFLHIAIVASLYAMLAMSLNFFSGNTGLLSLTHAGFYGLGAYGWALAAANGLSFALAPIIALAAVSLSALVVSLVAFRTRDDYFVIITLSVQMLIFDILNNFSVITNGPLGIRAIPQVPLISSAGGMAIFAVSSALVIYVALWRLNRSSWGANLRGIRDDELMMIALGKPVPRIKTITFLIGAAIAGYVGMLFAQYVTFIDPTSFTISESIVVLAMIVVGGLGSVHGALLAAVALVMLPEALRFFGIPGVAEGNARQMLYGAALVVIMLLRSGANTRVSSL